MTKPNYLAADVANLEADIAAILSTYPELADDAELRADMLEGETNLHATLTRLLSIERDADSMIKAIAERAADLGRRKSQTERRKDAMRALMLRIMRAADVKSIPLTEATVSVSKGRDSVEITDESQLPDNVIKIVRSPDKSLIKAELEKGEVAGAHIKIGEPTLTIRAA